MGICFSLFLTTDILISAASLLAFTGRSQAYEEFVSVGAAPLLGVFATVFHCLGILCWVVDHKASYHPESRQMLGSGDSCPMWCLLVGLAKGGEEGYELWIHVGKPGQT